MDNELLMECKQIKPVVAVGTDMNAAAITGARVALKNFDKVAIMVDMGASVGAVVDFTLKQHTASSGGTSKVLATANPYFKKVGAADVFTKVEQTSAASNYVLSADFATSAGLVVFEVLSEELDVDGGFSYVSIDMADSTAAKIVGAYYVLSNPRFEPAYGVATV